MRCRTRHASGFSISGVFRRPPTSKAPYGGQSDTLRESTARDGAAEDGQGFEAYGAAIRSVQDGSIAQEVTVAIESIDVAIEIPKLTEGSFPTDEQVTMCRVPCGEGLVVHV